MDDVPTTSGDLHTMGLGMAAPQFSSMEIHNEA